MIEFVIISTVTWLCSTVPSAILPKAVIAPSQIFVLPSSVLFPLFEDFVARRHPTNLRTSTSLPTVHKLHGIRYSEGPGCPYRPVSSSFLFPNSFPFSTNQPAKMPLSVRTPQNTPASNAPLSSHAQAPTIGDIQEGGPFRNHSVRPPADRLQRTLTVLRLPRYLLRTPLSYQ